MIAETGRVQAIVEHKEATPEQRAIGEVNSGVMCFRDEWLWPNLARLRRSPAGEFYLTDLVKSRAGQGEAVAAFPLPDPLEVIGLDNRLKLAQAEAEMRRRINERWMLAGVTLVHPETTYIEAGVEIGADTIIWPNTLLQGQTRIGQGCTIGPGSVIRDSTHRRPLPGRAVGGRAGHHGRGQRRRSVWPPAQGCAPGAGRAHGQFWRDQELVPGARAPRWATLATWATRRWAPGPTSAPGRSPATMTASTSTRPIIGEGAFIGSDTMLVAPVEIGEGAKTGAGSVVTRDVPPGQRGLWRAGPDQATPRCGRVGGRLT